MPPLFDPAERLSPRLQERLDAWTISPPRHQFQAYGPLNAYFQDIKFTSESFLVKPQALLRKEDNLNADEGNDSDTPDDPDRSIDSQGVGVTEVKYYPDFNVCQYYGADVDANPRADIIRIICEVGSLGADLSQLTRQLRRYLDAAGQRWEGHLLGIGLVGNEVTMIKNRDRTGRFRTVRVQGQDWISMFHPRFVEELNRLRVYCLQND